MEKVFKQKKGITLIALVITIIVLLILAGISISMLSGDNGILQKATDAKTKTERQSVIEQARTDVLGYQTENRGGDLEKTQFKSVLDTYFKDVPTAEELPEGEDLLNREFTTLDIYGAHTIKVSEFFDGDFKVEPKANVVSDKNGNFFPLPIGFYYVGGSVDSGIVISDEATDENKGENATLVGNQFVWVPVPVAIWDETTEIMSENYTPMAKLQNESTTNYEGLLYKFNGTTSSYESTYNITTTNCREPAYLNNSRFGDKSGKNNVGLTAESLQNEYNSVVKSISKYGGFYVGRYELGLDENNNPTSKAETIDSGITTASAYNSNSNGWYGLFSKIKEYNKSGITSTMMWGSQYDAMLNWMTKTGKNVGTADGNKRNGTYQTGKKVTDIINNIFDLYGCHYDWTLEAGGDKYRMSRGGNTGSNFYPGMRISNSPINSEALYGSRISFYINI